MINTTEFLHSPYTRLYKRKKIAQYSLLVETRVHWASCRMLALLFDVDKNYESILHDRNVTLILNLFFT